MQLFGVIDVLDVGVVAVIWLIVGIVVMSSAFIDKTKNPEKTRNVCYLLGIYPPVLVMALLSLFWLVERLT